MNHYKSFTIIHDDDDLFPYIVPEFIALEKKCRYRTMAAAKAAITRHEKCMLQYTLKNLNKKNERFN